MIPSRTDPNGRIVVVVLEPRAIRRRVTQSALTISALSDFSQSGHIAATDPGRRLADRQPPAPRVLAIANQKGGVGKTTTAINLGTALAAIGENVLIVDLDPQGNASTGLGIDRKNRRGSTYDVLTGEVALREAIVATAVPRLSIAPSTMDLSGLELEIGQERDRAFRLRNALAPLNAGKSPAPATTATCWSIARRRSICSPSTRWRRRTPSWCRCNASSSRSKACRNCCKTVEQVKTTLNPGLTIHGIVLTMYDARNNLSNQVVADVREFMGKQGLRHHHPAQRARLGSAVLRQAGAGLRSQMRRQRSLSAARDRDHPARKRAARGKLIA